MAHAVGVGVCVICGAEAHHYCSICDEWFCDACVHNWPLRAVHAGLKVLRKLAGQGG